MVHPVVGYCELYVLYITKAIHSIPTDTHAFERGVEWWQLVYIDSFV